MGRRSRARITIAFAALFVAVLAHAAGLPRASQDDPPRPVVHVSHAL